MLPVDACSMPPFVPQLFFHQLTGRHPCFCSATATYQSAGNSLPS